MEVLVGVAVILVLVSIGYPVYRYMQSQKFKKLGLANMQTLVAQISNFHSQHDGLLPDEDINGKTTWLATADKSAANCWYNALPRLAGRKGVGDYADNPLPYYSSENLLWVPAADYPKIGKQMNEPLFAIAMNTKLQRKDAAGNKPVLKWTDLTAPERTVFLLESGMKNEKQTHPSQPKYGDGPKGSAKTFIARYSGKGLIGFADGHVEAVAPSEVLTDIGLHRFPAEIIWGRTPEEDPN